MLSYLSLAAINNKKCLLMAWFRNEVAQFIGLKHVKDIYLCLVCLWLTWYSSRFRFWKLKWIRKNNSLEKNDFLTWLWISFYLLWPVRALLVLLRDHLLRKIGLRSWQRGGLLRYEWLQPTMAVLKQVQARGSEEHFRDTYLKFMESIIWQNIFWHQVPQLA